jgi:hypothetical protein
MQNINRATREARELKKPLEHKVIARFEDKWVGEILYSVWQSL